MNLNNAQNFVIQICNANQIRPLKLKLINLPQLNAKLCSNRNMIKITTYDLDILTDNEMYALLAHEVAHKIIYQRHTFSPYSITFCIFILLAIGCYFVSTLAVDGILWTILFIIYLATRASIFRHNEYNADYIGSQIVGTNCMLELLDTAIRTGGMEKRTTVFSKHPSLLKRKRYLAKNY